MVFNGIHRDSMVFNGISRDSMVFSGIEILGLSGSIWVYLGLYGSIWVYLGLCGSMCRGKVISHRANKLQMPFLANSIYSSDRFLERSINSCDNQINSCRH